LARLFGIGAEEITVAKQESEERKGQPEQPKMAGDAGGGQQAQSVTVDDTDVTACYANFCRVSSTPEELILDLALNPQPYATGGVTVHVSQRVILNHFTAKRLLTALSMALQRH
jgi:hypothetical protein